jgi:hypothetical protein
MINLYFDGLFYD